MRRSPASVAPGAPRARRDAPVLAAPSPAARRCRHDAGDDERQRHRRADRLPRRRRARAAARHRRPVPAPRPADPDPHRRLGRARGPRGARCSAARAATCPRALRCPATGTRRPLLACGAELKNTFCLAKGTRAWVSHHIGDLENYETLRSFTDGHRALPAAVRGRAGGRRPRPAPRVPIDQVRARARRRRARSASSTTTPTWPPAWPSTARPGPRSARSSTAPGYGLDGTVWGGELLFGDVAGRSAASGTLLPVRLPGGAQAIRQPWRMACAWLSAARRRAEPPRSLVGRVDARAWRRCARWSRRDSRRR